MLRLQVGGRFGGDDVMMTVWVLLLILFLRVKTEERSGGKS